MRLKEQRIAFDLDECFEGSQEVWVVLRGRKPPGWSRKLYSVILTRLRPLLR